MDPLNTSSKIAGAALAAQSLRMRVIAENMANANATGRQPGADPYRRKTVSFETEVEESVQGYAQNRFPFGSPTQQEP